jgi:hypothetical protein
LTKLFSEIGQILLIFENLSFYFIEVLSNKFTKILHLFPNIFKILMSRRNCGPNALAIQSTFETKVQKAETTATEQVFHQYSFHFSPIDKAELALSKAQAAYQAKVGRSEQVLREKLAHIQGVFDGKVFQYTATRDR